MTSDKLARTAECEMDSIQHNQVTQHRGRQNLFLLCKMANKTKNVLDGDCLVNQCPWMRMDQKVYKKKTEETVINDYVGCDGGDQ